MPACSTVLSGPTGEPCINPIYPHPCDFLLDEPAGPQSAAAVVAAAAPAPFTIFQDEEDKENGG